jgi:hypothetical protein
MARGFIIAWLSVGTIFGRTAGLWKLSANWIDDLGGYDRRDGEKGTKAK